MLASRRGFAIGCATAFALGMLAACNNSRGRGGTQPSASAPPSNQQEGAPYPADMEHLDQILAIGDGHSLPEDAQVSSVAPATNFAKEFPGGWGYIISFIATDAAIRKYVSKYSYAPASHIEEYPTVESERGGVEDVDLDNITSPWATAFGDATLILERPLGRGWLVIRGSSR